MEIKHILIGLLLAAPMSGNANTFQDIVNTNNRINRLSYIADKSDEWLTPSEMLANGGGDCEDFAISKYWDLRSKGFAPEDLLISYVSIQNNPQPHMVLMVKHNGETLVLDNISKLVLKRSERLDLKVVYQFNEKHIYLKGIRTANAQLIERWSHIINDMKTI
ncbi:exported hypothetical protein [Vibrio chagasii]|nr:exported hypothetical protein [Vibrio chagasii]CAH7349258.1 exported hypothetical protein [Vibrio chagasii]